MTGKNIFMPVAMNVSDGWIVALQEVVIDYITKPFEPGCFAAAARKLQGLPALIEVGA